MHVIFASIRGTVMELGNTPIVTLGAGDATLGWVQVH